MFSRHTIGKGSRSIAKPVTTFGIAMYRAKSTSLIQRPCMVLSQLYANGVHWNTEPTIVAMPVAQTRELMIMTATLNLIRSVVNTRT